VTEKAPKPKQNGALKIELKFEDAMAAALSTPPPPSDKKPPAKARES
jgi:hypothetical protein